MVDRHIKETLNLIRMQIHRDEPVQTGHTQQIRNHFRPNGDPRLIFPVLTRPSEIRNNGNDRMCRSTFGGIHHQQEFHQVVRIGECRLY